LTREGEVVRNVVILGSTGSIGKSAVEIVLRSRDRFRVAGLSSFRNTALLARQLELFPEARYATGEPGGIEEVERLLPGGTRRAAGSGQGGIEALIRETAPDIVVNALVGIAGLGPTLWALESGADVALANKETLVTAGTLVIGKAREAQRSIIPVDSEHFSLSRCLHGRRAETVEIVLTASGGPFHGRGIEELQDVGIDDVLAHPTWDMGRKVTVDSAHLLNKGLEVIEAHHLFDFPYEAIKVVIHPQSLVHSLTRFRDGSMLAHLGPADMRLPIMSALFHPEIVEFPWEVLELSDIGTLEFHDVDMNRFPAFRLAMAAAAAGGTAPAVLNAADEVAVDAFLAGRIGFLDIVTWIEQALRQHAPEPVKAIEDVFAADRWTREYLVKTHRQARI
jgi:1-deoxy-D-xylulose-5-phosphate reductoisomerase